MPWHFLLLAAADAVSLRCAGGLPEAGLPEAFFERRSVDTGRRLRLEVEANTC